MDLTADLLVIGSGAAGMSAAVAAARDGVEVCMITDRGLGTANSALAQGGVQYPGADNDSLLRFADDIRRAAESDIDDELLARFTEEVRPTVDELIAAGLVLDTNPGGDLVRRIAGGMSEPRVVTAGDRIGGPVLRVLRNQINELGVGAVTRTLVTDVIAERGRIHLPTEHGPDLHARAVIVATGGTSHRHAQAIEHVSSNPANRNHLLTDSLRLRDLDEIGADSFQWQPFGLVGSDGERSPGSLVPESIVELGVRLVDGEGAPIVDPMSGRLALTEAIFDTIGRGRGVAGPDGTDGVTLTLSEVPGDVLQERYPSLSRRLASAGSFGGDVVVRPFVHYQLGGFAIEPDCSTALPGVFLAGELTGGLHGRNRLMGNGLTDSLVHGRRAGAAAAAMVRGG